ncbi:hypothetical protein FACS1894124_6260 [Spirochaetia bacterium]|nr:hypothetical protein FACS1894124_6260 [Spirochaetia bacterium]
MKKTVIVLMALTALTPLLFGEPLEVWGHISTGLRFSAVQDSDWGAKAWQVQDKVPSMGVWHDGDETAVRLDLNAAYNRPNYGLIFRTRIKPYELYETFMHISDAATDKYWNDEVWARANELLNNAYGWAEFGRGLVRMSMGKIEDPDLYYDTGLGLRLIVQPTNEFKAGVFFNADPRRRQFLDEAKGSTEKNNMMSDDEARWSAINLAEDFIAETAIGARYSSPLFDLGAGVKFDSKGDGIEEWDAEGWETRRSAWAVDNGDTGIGFRAFFIFNLKAITDVPIELVADGFNLFGFEKYGWIRFSEKVNWIVSRRLNLEFYMEQMVFGREALWDSGWGVRDYDGRLELLPANTKLIYTNPMPRMYFRPGVSYDLTDRWTAKMWLNCVVWPENYFSVEPNPWIGYRLSDSVYISGSYKFVLRQFDDTFRKKANGNAPDSWINHHVQLTAAWSF